MCESRNKQAPTTKATFRNLCSQELLAAIFLLFGATTRLLPPLLTVLRGETDRRVALPPKVPARKVGRATGAANGDLGILVGAVGSDVEQGTRP